jgi:hypothetical protein
MRKRKGEWEWLNTEW